MSNADEPIILEGGEVAIANLLGQAVHEGGNSASLNSLVPASASSASSADETRGVESTLQNGNPVAHVAAQSSLLDGGKRTAILEFNFPSAPFQPSANRDTPTTFEGNTPGANLSSALSSTTPLSDTSSRRSSENVVNIPLSQMSAKDLAQVVAGDVHNLNTGLWIAEDISGTALLKHVAPSALAEFLEAVLKIQSQFTRSRIQSCLLSLISKDLSIDAGVRECWEQFNSRAVNFLGASPRDAVTQGGTPTSVLAPQNLFATPIFGAVTRANTASSPPAFFSGRPSSKHNSSAYAPPAFLKECGAPEEFPLADSSLFANTTRASVSAGGANVGSQAYGGGINITINQPSATPPKYVILESASDSTQFYNWIRKNRKETLLALPVDRRTLSQLVAEDVKDEVVRIMKHLGPTNTFYFNDETCPYPKMWPEVSDLLLLKILFAMNGPRSAAEAKTRLKSRLFFFNDSTTSQDKLTGKLRKFCNEFKSTLKDFAYTHHLWDVNDNLDHAMIVEAFSDCFSSAEQIKGPSGTMVPKSINHAKIKEMIRERKSLSLEDIIHHVIDAYERVDLAVRANKAISYGIQPWKSEESKKRGYNQMSGNTGQGGSNAKKPPRPPAEHPRCNNCGRKSHLCGERSCYLFGHAKGRGANGHWAEGEPSLFIDKEEMKTWKVKRDPVFYAYPENQRPKTKGS
jgi:hypothetical protein